MEQRPDEIFAAKCRKIMAERGCSIREAARLVQTQQPALFKSYMDELLSLSGQKYE